MRGSLGPHALVAIWRLAVDTIVDSVREALGAPEHVEIPEEPLARRAPHLRLVTNEH
jgi:hypothetical protein